VQGPGLQPVSSPQSETNDNDPASQVSPPKLLPQDQNKKQVAGQPAAFDPNFLTEIGNYLDNVGKPTIDVSEIPSFAEAEFLEACLTNDVSSSQASLENIPREVSGNGVAQEKTSNGVSYVEENVDVLPPQPEVFSVNLGPVDDYLVRPPKTLSNILPTPVSAPGEVSSHGVAQKETSTGVSYVEAELMDFETSPQPETSSSNNLGHLKDYLETFSENLSTPVSFPVNTDRGIPLFVQVAPIPAQCTPAPSAPLRSQSVIVQGPALANKLLTTQPQCGNPMNTGVRNTEGGLPFVIQVASIPVQISPVPSAPPATRGKKVPKTNAERCQVYRKRQKSKKEKDEEELRQLDAKNRALKAKEAALRNKVRRIKEAARRMGLGNYFN